MSVRIVIGLVIFLLSGASVSTAVAAFYDEKDMASFLSANYMPLHGRTETVSSNMQDLFIWWVQLPESDATGGALATFEDILLIVQPTGEVLWLNTRTLEGPYSTTIAAPMNTSALISSDIADSPRMNLRWFRVAGAHVEPVEGALRLFVVHHVFEKACFFLQVSAIDLTFDATTGLAPLSDWQRIFRPEPCIPLVGFPNRRFAGHQSGGKIVSIGRDYLLVAYGDHELDGRMDINGPQDPGSPYGKIWKVAKDGSSAEIYASGFRNQQGLLVDSDGRIWASEHGPQGGDELNLIVEGKTTAGHGRLMGCFTATGSGLSIQCKADTHLTITSPRSSLGCLRSHRQILRR